MENYDLNIHWGIKTIKVTFQIGEYKGYVTYRGKGNTKGASLLRVDADDLYDMTFVDNNAQLKDLGDEWYSMVLKDKNGEELLDEGEWDDLSDYIVAIEIIDIVEDYDQLQLNENQQIVLDYLKDKCNLYSFISYKPFEAIIRLSMLDPEKNELRVTNTIDELTYLQQSQVLEIFSRWALEQEEK